VCSIGRHGKILAATTDRKPRATRTWRLRAVRKWRARGRDVHFFLSFEVL
jgi:hypothetical protein